MFVTGDRICAYISAMLYRLPTIFQSSSGSTKNFEIWNPNRPPRLHGGDKDDISMGESVDTSSAEESTESYTELDLIRYITSACADNVRAIISKHNLMIAALCSFHTIQTYKDKKEPMSDELINEYIETHNKLYSGIGWEIKTWPPLNIKEKYDTDLKPFKYQNLISDEPYKTEFSNYTDLIYHRLLENFPDLDEFITKKENSLSSASVKLLQEKPIGILSLGLIGDLIQNPANSGSSVISTYIFREFLPPNPSVPKITSWTESEQHVYRILISSIPTVLRTSGTVSKEAIGLARGGRRRKTFRRKHNGVSKRSNKHTYRKTSRSHRKRRTSDRGRAKTGAHNDAR